MMLGEFVGLFAQRPSAFAWFIGAGASRMSGLPTANDVIADLKRRYYCREEGEEISLQDMHNDAVRTRIQSFMDARGFPAQWSAQEYSGYFDKIFGAEKERQRNYLAGILAEDKVKLTVGNRVLTAMLAGGLARAVFTTNFDPVVERAYAEISGRALPVFHLEGSTAALQALNQEEFPLYVKLHGDFRYDSIKNLTADLAEQDRHLARTLVAAVSRFGLVVAGYSGRDESVIAVLREALDQPNAFPAGLFWAEIKNARILPTVTDLIERAQAKGVRSSIVEIETYDTFMLRLWRNIEDKPAGLDDKVRRSAAVGVAVPLPAAKGVRPLVRLNALPVRELPRRALVVRTKRPVEWKRLKELERDATSPVIFTKGRQILAWGASMEIARLLGDDFVGADPVELPESPDGPDQLHIKGFLEEGLIVALARGRPLVSRTTRVGGALIVDRRARDTSSLNPVKASAGGLFGPIPKLATPATDQHPVPEPLFWAEALRVSLNWKDGKPWLLVDPDIWIWPPRGRELATEFLDQKRRGRFNNRYNELLSAWIDALFGARSAPIDLAVSLKTGSGHADDPRFTIGSQTAFSWRQTA
jgi:hypothetical protein